MKAFLLALLITGTTYAAFTEYDHAATGGGGGGPAGVASFEGRTGNVISSPTDYTASEIINVPNAGTGGLILDTNVQDALNFLDSAKINRQGDAMTGTLAFNAGMTFYDNDLPIPNFISFNVLNDLSGNTSFILPDGDGPPSTFLTTDGSGNLSWASPVGSFIVDDDNDTQIQTQETLNENKIRFDTATVERMIIDEVGTVGINTTTPNNVSSILDIDSTTKGVLVPRTTRASITTPTEGLVIYDTDLDALVYYDAAQAVWRILGRDLWDLNGNTGISLDQVADDDVIRFQNNGNASMVVDLEGDVGIATGVTAVNPLAQLEVSATDKGVMIPRMTEEERDLIAVTGTPLVPVIAEKGLTVFVTTANAGADEVNRFSYFDGGQWQYLVDQKYVDDADYGAGALSVYTTSLSGTDIILDQETIFNFIDRSVGGAETSTQVTIPAGTIIVPGGSVPANTTRYVSVKYVGTGGNLLAGLLETTYYSNPNVINLGNEILLTGPYTDVLGNITGTVQFQHYASNHAGTYTAYLDGGERSKFISGGSVSLVDPDAATSNLLEFTVGSGRTFQTLMRDVQEESVWTLKDSDVAGSYRYRADSDAYVYVAPGAGNFAIDPKMYFDRGGTDALAVAGNNQFTIHAVLAFMGSAGNQFIGTHLGNKAYSTLENAEGEIFSGSALVGRSEGSISAGVIAYIIVRGGIANDFTAATEGTDWKVIGNADTVGLSIASGSAVNLGNLNDVTLTTPNPGEVLSYDGAVWINQAPSAGATITDLDGDTNLTVDDGGNDNDEVTWNLATVAAPAADHRGSISQSGFQFVNDTDVVGVGQVGEVEWNVPLRYFSLKAFDEATGFGDVTLRMYRGTNYVNIDTNNTDAIGVNYDISLPGNGPQQAEPDTDNLILVSDTNGDLEYRKNDTLYSTLETNTVLDGSHIQAEGNGNYRFNREEDGALGVNEPAKLILEGTDANTVTVSAPTANIPASYTIKVPEDVPTSAGQVLQVNNVNLSNIATMEWGAPVSPIETVTQRGNVEGPADSTDAADMRGLRIGNTQMYWGRTKAISAGSNLQITFPVTFSTRPSVTVSSASRNGLLCATGTGGNTKPTTTTSMRIYAEGGGNNFCDFFVIGTVAP